MKQDVYDERPNLYIGFHGCDRSVGQKLLNNPDEIKISDHSYEWLGHGFYVWENNYERAFEWAQSRKTIEKPFVLGVVYTLGSCLDLTDKRFIDPLAKEYELLVDDFIKIGKPLPKNEDVHGDANHDELLRKLDCAVIQHIFETNEVRYDSARGTFLEGEPAYDGAMFRKKTHIQVCLRNMNCIKGLFLPRRYSSNF